MKETVEACFEQTFVRIIVMIEYAIYINLPYLKDLQSNQSVMVTFTTSLLSRRAVFRVEATQASHT